MIRRWLFRLARSRFATYFIGNAFAYLTPLMPLNKLYENEQVIAFRHPVPFWQTHSLVVPKKQIPSFLDLSLSQTENQKLAVAIFQAVQIIAAQMDLTEYSVLVNGGNYQDVPQLHFHVAAGSKSRLSQEHFEPPSPEANVERHQAVFTYPHPRPIRKLHQIICSEEQNNGFASLKLEDGSWQMLLFNILDLAQKIVVRHQLVEYTLLTNISALSSEKRLVFHLVSGDGV